MIEAKREFDTKEHGKVIVQANRLAFHGTRVEVVFDYLGVQLTRVFNTYHREAYSGDVLKATSYLNSLTEDKAAQLVSNLKNGFNLQ